jgi:hypothetical protein
MSKRKNAGVFQVSGFRFSGVQAAPRASILQAAGFGIILAPHRPSVRSKKFDDGDGENDEKEFLTN